MHWAYCERGVTGYITDRCWGEFMATPISSHLCKTVLPLNTHTRKNTKSQLKYSLYFDTPRTFYADGNTKQSELFDTHEVVGLSQVPWKHSYRFSHVSAVHSSNIVWELDTVQKKQLIQSRSTEGLKTQFKPILDRESIQLFQIPSSSCC